MSNIRIKISNNMSENIDVYDNENRMLRIPRELRQNLGLELGQNFTLNSVQNTPIILQVGAVFKNDKVQDNGVCYVTDSIFKEINIENAESYKVVAVKGITLGCDPEFFLIDKKSKKILRANAFFKKWGEVGCDGILAELRPQPAVSVDGLTNNIYKLICNTREILNLSAIYEPSDIIMHAASSYNIGLPNSIITGMPTQATAGFHLHFGLPKYILGKTPNIMALMFKIVKAMDYYIGLPSIMLETSTDAKRRSNTQVNYGKPSDFRLDYRTLEYRVPGGSMLKHPILTRGLIALGAVVVEDIISKVKFRTNGFKHLYWMQQNERLKELYPNILETEEMFSLICSPSATTARKYLDIIYTDIQSMSGFDEKKEDLDNFFYHIKTNIQYDNNMEYNWRNFYGQQ